MDEPSPQPSEPASFDHADQVGQVEMDRYCVGCGYNLRQQAVRREPVTGLLLCKCPECGAFEPANQAMTRPRSWFGSLVVLLWLLWIAAVGGALVGAISATGSLAYEIGELMSDTHRLDKPIPDPRDTTGNSIRTVSFQFQMHPLDSERTLLLSLLMLGGFGVALGLSSVFQIFVPHWPRKGYVALALGWPVLSLIVFIGLRLTDRYTLDYATSGLRLWIYLSPLLVMLFAYAGGLTGVCLSRPTARLLIRILIPARQRGPFAYLWLVDGKVPTKTT